MSRVLDPGLRARLKAIEDDIVAASQTFDAAAGATQLHAIARQASVGAVSRHELARVYDSRFARQGSPGRRIYDELLSAAPQGRCPLCGHRSVSTLDHHLPKTHYPALVVTPTNLVPTCADCNKAKRERYPMANTEETFHPYFDAIEDDPWLSANVVETKPAALRFLVSSPPHWDDVTRDRASHHFEVFGLAALYASQAAEELSNIQRYISNLFGAAGQAGVTSHLSDMAASCRASRVNSWQSATYQALAASAWYCSGGFSD